MSKHRLQHPVTEQVYQALNDIEQAEERLSKALCELPKLIGDNEELRRAVICHLYWFEEKIKPSWIADVFGLIISHVGRAAGQATATRICGTCNQSFDFTVTSRAGLKGYSTPTRCEPCREKAELARSQENSQYIQEYNARAEARKTRLIELRTMPYREYLQTPEWQERRLKAMKRAGFRCQVCNAYGVRLNTHHRTYERRGNEDDRDLIVLCEACHQIFHENGSLAEVAS